MPCCAPFNVGWEVWLDRPAEGMLLVLNSLDVAKVSVKLQKFGECEDIDVLMKDTKAFSNLGGLFLSLAA